MFSNVTDVKPVVSLRPSTLRSFGVIGSVPNRASIISPPSSTVVISRGRGRPKGIKNKSTLVKLKFEAIKANGVSPQKPGSNAQILTKVFNDKLNDCNCKLKGCCKQKFNKAFKKFEEKHKEYSKKLEKELKSVKQEKYRLLNENKLLNNEYQRDGIKALIEKQSQEIKELKKKQWCRHCGKEAIYFCCWNGSYCSIDCQRQDWINGHKKICRRMAKRSNDQSAKYQIIDSSKQRKISQQMTNTSKNKISIQTHSKSYEKLKSKFSLEPVKKISIREEDEQEYLHLIRSRPNGWDYGLTPLEIIGINCLNKNLVFLVKWTNQEKSIVLSEDAKHFCPQLIIKFYEKHIVWGKNY